MIEDMRPADSPSVDEMRESRERVAAAVMDIVNSKMAMSVEDAMAAHGLDKAGQRDAIEAMLDAHRANVGDGEAGGRARPDEPEGRKTAKEMREKAKAELKDKYPGGRMEIERGKPWEARRVSDDTAMAVRADGTVATLHPGDAHNFGGKDAPVWRVWRGGDTWEDNASPAEIQRAYDMAKRDRFFASDEEDFSPDKVFAPLREPPTPSPESSAAGGDDGEDTDRGEDRSREDDNGSVQNITITPIRSVPAGESGRVQEIHIEPIRSGSGEAEPSEEPHGGRSQDIHITPIRSAEADPDRPGPIHESPEREGEDDFELGRFDKRDYIGIRPLTLDEIANNPTHQQFFGEFFQSYAPGRMDIHARAMAKGDLADDERALVNHAQYEYTKLFTTWEHAKPLLTPAFMEEMAARDEKFRICAVDARGSQTVMQAVLRSIPHIAMRRENREMFYKFAHDTHSLKENRDTWTARGYTRRVLNQCAANGIDPRDYDTFFNVGGAEPESRAETIARLRNHYREHYGRFRKSVDDGLGFLGFGTAARARYNLFKANWKDMEANAVPVLRDVNRNLNEITSFLAPAVTENPVVLEALTRGAYTGEGISFSEEAGPQTRAAMNFEALDRGVLSPERLRARFEEIKRTARTTDGRDWAHMNEAEHRAIRDRMLPPGEISRVHGFGLWAWIKRLLAMDIFRARRDALSIA